VERAGLTWFEGEETKYIETMADLPEEQITYEMTRDAPRSLKERLEEVTAFCTDQVKFCNAAAKKLRKVDTSGNEAQQAKKARQRARLAEEARERLREAVKMCEDILP
jgi:hypothetical protein